MITEEQREARRQGLGGSDIAAIIPSRKNATGTLSPWQTQVGVWNSKLHPEDEKRRQESEAMVWGNMEEELVAKRFTDLTEKRLMECPNMIVDGCLIANLDRLVIPNGKETALGENGVITAEELFEAKTSSQAWDEADIVEMMPNGTQVRDGSQGVPDYYLTQCFHYLGRVKSAGRIYVAVKANVPRGRFARTEFGIYVVERDDAMIAQQDEYARAWWERHIIRGEKPEPVCEEDCKVLWRKSVPSTHITVTPELLRAYVDLGKASKAKEVAEQEESEARAVFKKAMGDSEAVVGEDGETVLATWKSARDTTRVETDWEAVAKSLALSSNMSDDEWEDEVAKHTTTETKKGARTFRLKESKKVQEYVDAHIQDDDSCRSGEEDLTRGDAASPQ